MPSTDSGVLIPGGGITAAEVAAMIGQYGGYRFTGDFSSTATQQPAGNAVDVVTPVVFGVGGVTSDGVLSVAGTGIITQLKTGYWSLKSRARAKRTGGSGSSELFFQFYTRATDLDAWEFIGVSVDIELDNSRQTEIVFDKSFFFGEAGRQYYLGWARSGNGSNSGDLVSGAPTAALIAQGVQSSPSAQMSIATMANYNYDGV